MQRISRAPVLSATFRRVSFWITARLLRLLEDVDEAPALGARHRAALDHAHGVARARVVALVVGVELRRGAQDLPVAPVAAGGVDAHDDRLVGLVRDDDALAHLGAARAVLGRDVGLGRGLVLAGCGCLRLRALAVVAAQLGLVRAGGEALGVALLGGLGAGGGRGLRGALARPALLGGQDLLRLGGGGGGRRARA